MSQENSETLGLGHLNQPTYCIAITDGDHTVGAHEMTMQFGSANNKNTLNFFKQVPHESSS